MGHTPIQESKIRSGYLIKNIRVDQLGISKWPIKEIIELNLFYENRRNHIKLITERNFCWIYEWDEINQVLITGISYNYYIIMQYRNEDLYFYPNGLNVLGPFAEEEISDYKKNV